VDRALEFAFDVTQLANGGSDPACSVSLIVLVFLRLIDHELRKGDVLALTKAAIRDGKIWRRTNKTGQEVSIPVHPDLARLLETAPRHASITIAATTNGTPWTESGFNSSFIKAMTALKRGGKIGQGLTFHGLRHTVGTLLIEAGYDLDTVRRWLGQKTLAMAIHYSETADTSQRMSQVIKKFDPLGSKSRT